MNTEEKNVAEEVEYYGESVLATVGEWSADSCFELEDRFKQMKQLQNMLFVMGTKFPDGLDYDTLAFTVLDRADYMTNDLYSSGSNRDSFNHIKSLPELVRVIKDSDLSAITCEEEFIDFFLFRGMNPITAYGFAVNEIHELTQLKPISQYEHFRMLKKKLVHSAPLLSHIPAVVIVFAIFESGCLEDWTGFVQFAVNPLLYEENLTLLQLIQELDKLFALQLFEE